MNSKKQNRSEKFQLFLCLLLLSGMLMACGRKQTTDSNNSNSKNEPMEYTEAEDATSEMAENIPQSGQSMDGGASGASRPAAPEDIPEDVPERSALTEKFGENCIAGQTFEVELSEYDEKVYFVPFAPSAKQPDFHMQIYQDGTVLFDIPAYIPESLSGEKFTSLDAVSFFDINYDGNTDILLIETYGSTAFAAVYYGFSDDDGDYGQYFVPQELLSANITNQVTPLTVPGICSYLSDGKKNGSFANYQEAYEAVSRLCVLENELEPGYGLIYFDDNDIPELAAGASGYYTSLYTFLDGTVYMLMDRWPYGAMGNAGYEYSPRKNSLRNYNTDYAGAILYTTYMFINSQSSLEIAAQVKTVNFDDVNGNGSPDEDETDSLGNYSISYIDGLEASPEECAAYDVGDYEYIDPRMSLEELMAQLNSPPTP